MSGKKLYDSTWPEIDECADKGKVVVIPTGSCEQHGAHLPLGTDGYIPQEIANRLCTMIDVLVAPLVPYGHSSNHANFSGTISISVETYSRFMRDIIDSFLHHKFKKFVFLNGHSGNTPTLQYLCGYLRNNSALGVVFDWFEVAGQLSSDFRLSGHADALETAPLLSSHPHLVRMEKAVPYEVQHLSKNITINNWSQLEYNNIRLPTWLNTEDASPNGNFGTLDKANADHGEAVYTNITQFLVSFILELSKINDF